MTATNSVAVRTGNVSAGTSVFAMVVLEENLKKVHEEIDLVTTPDGHLVGMVHCNNCTSDLNAWVGLFEQFYEMMGQKVDKILYLVIFTEKPWKGMLTAAALCLMVIFPESRSQVLKKDVLCL